MSFSYIDEQFIEWCKKISPEINPYIFINEYAKYETEYRNKIKSVLKELYAEIHTKYPNVNFYMRGRIKSKLSSYIKTFLKLVENIDRLFSSKLTKDQREILIRKYFGYYLNSSIDSLALDDKQADKYNNLKNLIFTLSSDSINSFDAFSIVLHNLTPEEQTFFIKKLGLTEDIFAYKLVIRDSSQPAGFVISKFRTLENGTYEITTGNNKTISVSPSVKIDPSSEVRIKSNGLIYVVINGHEYELNEQNLLYPKNISVRKRHLKNALRDSDNKITLLRDYLILPDGDILYIDAIFSSNNINYIKSGGEIRNLDKLLKNPHVRLYKNDEVTLHQIAFEIETLCNQYLTSHGFHIFSYRRKDYITTPKQTGYGHTIHNSYVCRSDGYYAEGQIGNDYGENNYHSNSSLGEATAIDHDNYKREKIERMAARNKVVQEILAAEPLALDSSSSAIKQLLYAHPEIPIKDVLPCYIVTVLTGKGIEIADLSDAVELVFNYFFKNVPNFDYKTYIKILNTSFKFPPPDDYNSPDSVEADNVDVYGSDSDTELSI